MGVGEFHLETERLVLRPPARDDLPWVAGAMNSPAVMRHLGGVRSPEAVADSFAGDLEAFASGGYRRWTVWLKDGSCRVGRCGMFHVRAEAAPGGLRGQHEIGWSLAEAHWGRGYAAEAARAVLGFGFDRLDLPAIYAQTSDSNGGSTRLMLRLGFTRFPQFDYVDPAYPAEDNPTTVYRLERADWERGR